MTLDLGITLPDATGATLAIAYLTIAWTIRIVFIPVAIRGHRPPEAIAWMAIVFFQPLVGLLLYLFFARPVLGRKRIARHRFAARTVRTREREQRQDPHRVDINDVDPAHRDLVRLARSLGQQPLLAGNTVELLTDTQQVVDTLIREVDRAEHHVHLLFFVFQLDEMGEPVVEALRRAVDRGVRCRVIVDAVGSRLSVDRLRPRFRDAGVEFQVALPVRLLRWRFARIDVRNHRKLAVIDGRVAITGSQNICRPDYGSEEFGPWLDMSARLTGPIVYQLQLHFLDDWVTETATLPDEPTLFDIPEPTGDVPIQSVPSGPDLPNRAFRDLLVSAISEANHRVIITNPYFVPDEPTLLALRLRALAGLQVDLIVPENGNSIMVNAASRSYFQSLLEAGVNVHLHRPGLLHAKTMTIDDAFALLGSGNFDRRSFTLNFELNLLLFGEDVTRRLRDRQSEYLRDSRPLTLEELGTRGPLRRFLDDAAKLLGPLL